MVKGLKRLFFSFIWVSILFTLTACSAEELLMEVPQTAQMEPAQPLEEWLMAENPEEVQEGEAEFSFLGAYTYPYAYNNLSAEEKLWYSDIEAALGSMQEEVRLSDESIAAGLDESCIDKIFQCVLNDHPELFYVSGYTYTIYARGEETVAISFSGTYELTPEEALSRKQEIESAAELWLEGIAEDASEYDKVKYVYETIVRNTDYDLNAADNQNIYSVFVRQKSVCQGYAKAAQYLLNRLGVECTMVQGTVDNGQGHAWNLVRVDGSYYYMDVTWGDASYQSDGEAVIAQEQLPEINYDYLCITTSQLLRTHVLGNCVPLPECIDMAANYYVRQGCYFESYDKELLKSLFDEAFEAGKMDVTVKCADVACYQEMQTALIENQEIFDYISNGSAKVGYASNEEQLSMTFWMTNS